VIGEPGAGDRRTGRDDPAVARDRRAVVRRRVRSRGRDAVARAAARRGAVDRAPRGLREHAAAESGTVASDVAARVVGLERRRVAARGRERAERDGRDRCAIEMTRREDVGRNDVALGARERRRERRVGMRGMRAGARRGVVAVSVTCAAAAAPVSEIDTACTSPRSGAWRGLPVATRGTTDSRGLRSSATSARASRRPDRGSSWCTCACSDRSARRHRRGRRRA